MRRGRASLAVVALLLAACGGAGEPESGRGSATLWITRDGGREVLHEGPVEAGQSVLKALQRHAEVETRYGGRFVQAIDGLEGSFDRGTDWFFFVNGIAADRGAAEYRLREGDVAWWDYHAWAGEEEVRVVVGAFPEPFLHGYDGRVREAVVTYESPGQRDGARAVARLLGGRVLSPGAEPPRSANVFAVVAGRERFEARLEGGPDGRVRFTFAGDAAALVRDPGRYRFRYRVGMP